MKQLLKLAGIWIVLFSFAVESTGAAGIPMLAAPMAARSLMPPPSRQALAALPALAPTAPPKVEVPAEWGYYVLAAAEIFMEELAAGRASLVETGRAADIAWRQLSDGLSSNLELVEAPLAPIDLPTVPAAPTAMREISEAAVMPAPELVESRMLVVPEPLSVSRAPEIDVAHAIPPPPAPGTEPISLWGLFSSQVPETRPAPLTDAVGPWIQGKGMRYRLTFKSPIGVSRADAWGVAYTIGGRQWRENDQILPSRYWGVYPVYFRGDPKDIRIEVENTGKVALEDLRVSADEEEFNPGGGTGARLPVPAVGGAAAMLEPGHAAVLEGTLAGQQISAGHFTQTHLRVTAGDGGGTHVLSDEPQAGLIDPPGR